MELTLSELKPIIQYMIDNNKKLETENKKPIAINISGDAGIGKTALIQEIANENDCNFVKMNLAQITETGDLAGFPVCLHRVCKDDDCQWITAQLIESYARSGYTITADTKMSYALPEWYTNIDVTKGLILLLDDYSRATPNILQAVYELIYQQEFWSFKLPDNTTIILTSNPEGGDYNVNCIDEAGQSRMVTFDVKFDVDSWAKWAEMSEIDNRVINFMLNYSHELMAENDTHTHIMNARSYTMFGNIISGINDWEVSNNLALILQIASGCFNDKDNVVGCLFTSFIANKLDKLVSPEDILLKSWNTLKPELLKCVYDNDGQYRADVASILHTRLLNYTIYYFSKSGAKTDAVQDRLLELIESDTMIFAEDLLFSIIKTLMKLYPTRTNKFVLNRKIRQMI